MPEVLSGFRALAPSLRVFALAAALLVPAAGAQEPPAAARAEILAALERSLTWLRFHPPDPQRDKLGELGLDAVAWYLFAAFHPEPAVRKEAGAALDRRLENLPPPGDQDVVSLSYWAVLLRVMRLRGLDVEAHRARLAAADLAAVLAEAYPTTRWWTAELLRRSGLDVAADFSETFIASEAAAAGSGTASPQSYTVREAYRLFHELVPATDLGQAPPSLTAGQQTFLRDAVPPLIVTSRLSGDTDALAEILVCAALLEQRDTPAYRGGLRALLAAQRPDGTFLTRRGARASENAADHRHVVQVASWALLGSLPEKARP